MTLSPHVRGAARAARIVIYRLQRQGLRITLLWLFGRGLPLITGVPIVRFSRITPQVFVGPQYRRLGKRRLEAMGLTHGINLRVEFDDAAHGLALENYCHLPTVDDGAPTLEHLEKGVAFVQEAVSNGGKVYIHCAGGVGRAPTMAAAFFVSTGMTTDEALAFIQKHRPFIYLVPEQTEQLRRFEAALHDGR